MERPQWFLDLFPKDHFVSTCFVSNCWRSPVWDVRGDDETLHACYHHISRALMQLVDGGHTAQVARR